MTDGERRFCTVSLIWGIVYSILVPIGAAAVLKLGKIPETVVVIYIFGMGFNLVVGLSIVALSRINLKSDRLRPVATGFQLVLLLLTGYGIPIAAWGYVLLRRRRAERLDTDESNYQRQREDGDA